jgi:hypothetical protein
MSVELKVKVKSLAEEARIIRKEEHKAKRSKRWHAERQQTEQAEKYARLRNSLYEHRLDVVRFECRAAELARAFIKGTPYRKVERNTHDGPYQMGRIQGRVQKLVNKYHDKAVTPSMIQQWMNTE